MSSLRARLCWALSTRSSECSPMTGPRMALPLPAWTTSGAPAKISRTCSGRLKTTSHLPSGRIRIENTSPYFRCRCGIQRCRNLIRAMLCASAGYVGPAGTCAGSTRTRTPWFSGRIRSKRASVRGSTCVLMDSPAFGPDATDPCGGADPTAVGDREQQLHQAGAPSDRRSLRAAARAELGEDVGDVHAHRLGGDEQLLSDLAVAATVGHQLEDL